MGITIVPGDFPKLTGMAQVDDQDLSKSSVEATIDCTGKVTSARVLTGLGHGLDQAAITAIQKTEFQPAPRCAPGFQKAMKINYAFRLGD